MRIGIVGLGSVLMGDDALGPYAVKLLEAAYEFPPEVSVIDAGTPGPDLADYLLGFDALIILDTVRSGGAPGQLRLIRREEILRQPAGPRLSPHDPGLGEALVRAELAGRAPREVLVIGVVPAAVALRTALSPEVAAALPRVEAAVVEELARLGVSPRKRPAAAAPEIWWEK